VLILLPPSEGKTAPRRGAKLDLSSLVFGEELRSARQVVIDALLALCDGPSETAMHTLELPPGLAGEIETNRALLTAPTTTAARLYTGVLFEHLGLETLDSAAKRRANRSVLIAGGLWGVVAPGDRIPAYRLSGSVTLPPLGTLAGHWRGPLGAVLPARAGRGLILDLRSGSYVNAWRPTGALAERTVTVRVTQNGKVVSHHNKATKGLLARAILEAGVDPKKPDALAQLCKELGFEAVLSPPAPGRSRELSVDDAR
jgi:cytoplasmic iron level regulating protein YaaA (DUF328/UPF0246 family)